MSIQHTQLYATRPMNIEYLHNDVNPSWRLSMMESCKAGNAVTAHCRTLSITYNRRRAQKYSPK